MSHPTTRLDPAIHQPARLGILTAAAETKAHRLRLAA
jgi:hypothetical protein